MANANLKNTTPKAPPTLAVPEYVTNYTTEDTFPTVALFTLHRELADGTPQRFGTTMVGSIDDRPSADANGDAKVGRIFTAPKENAEGIPVPVPFWWLGENRGSDTKPGVGGAAHIGPVPDAMAENLRYLRLWVNLAGVWTPQDVPVAPLGAQRIRKPLAVFTLGQRNASDPNVGARSLLIDGASATLKCSPAFSAQGKGTGLALHLNLTGEVVKPEAERIDLGGWD
jgi:hypothetical protein